MKKTDFKKPIEEIVKNVNIPSGASKGLFPHFCEDEN